MIAGLSFDTEGVGTALLHSSHRRRRMPPGPPCSEHRRIGKPFCDFEDLRAPLRGGFRPGFNLRARQDAKRNLTSSRETRRRLATVAKPSAFHLSLRTIQPLRGIRLKPAVEFLERFATM